MEKNLAKFTNETKQTAARLSAQPCSPYDTAIETRGEAELTDPLGFDYYRRAGQHDGPFGEAATGVRGRLSQAREHFIRLLEKVAGRADRRKGSRTSELVKASQKLSSRGRSYARDAAPSREQSRVLRGQILNQVAVRMGKGESFPGLTQETVSRLMSKI